MGPRAPAVREAVTESKGLPEEDVATLLGFVVKEGGGKGEGVG